jgi:hypothetical protein
MPYRYSHLLEALVIDLVAIVIVAFFVYYRRHRRADMLFAFVALNVGLFAILSIIRLRSDPIAPEEAAYYFIALILGLINGVQFRDAWLAIALDVAIVVVIVGLDNKWVMPDSRRQLVTLDVVHPDEVALVADLERRLGGKVTRAIVKQVDYVRDVTVVDVRYAPQWPRYVERPVPTSFEVAER